MEHVDITEVSDPHLLTLDEPAHAVPEIRVLRGRPTPHELAAVVTVLAAAGGGGASHGPEELNLWGHPVDRLRYGVTSWQRVTLLERTHMRR